MQVTENPEKNRQATTFVIIVSILITCYLTANAMAVKLINVKGITIFDAGTIIFPITYMLGDVLTEIWGFKTAKKVIWLTFLCEIIFTFFTWIGTFLPYPEETTTQAIAYETVFGIVPRITLASLIAFLCGELINSWSFEAIKKKTKGKWFGIRAIGSSIFGYTIDTTLFVLIAFYGTVPHHDLFTMIVIQIIVKLALESFFATPFAYAFTQKFLQKLK
ncbi:MAG: queuosine precursor transporter [Paludibacteraceae bacterium]|nr:queuosine precursor transporter [Paludibacteraceae bacterium]